MDDYFAKRTEICQILGKFLDEKVEDLEVHGCLKIQENFDPKTEEEMWFLLELPIQTQNDTSSWRTPDKFVC